MSHQLSAYTDSVHRKMAAGLPSPDCRHALFVDMSHIPYQIKLSDGISTRVLCSNAGTGTMLKNISSSKPRVPLCWLDNEHFLMTSFNRRDSSAFVIRFDLSGKADTVCRLSAVHPGVMNSRFDFLPGDSLVRIICGQYLLYFSTATGEKKSLQRKENKVRIEDSRDGSLKNILINDSVVTTAPLSWYPRALFDDFVLMESVNEKTWNIMLHYWSVQSQMWKSYSLRYGYSILGLIGN